MWTFKQSYCSFGYGTEYPCRWPFMLPRQPWPTLAEWKHSIMKRCNWTEWFCWGAILSAQRDFLRILFFSLVGLWTVLVDVFSEVKDLLLRRYKSDHRTGSTSTPLVFWQISLFFLPSCWYSLYHLSLCCICLCELLFEGPSCSFRSLPSHLSSSLPPS